MIRQHIASQLKRPSGIVGRYLLPVLWNRWNRALNDATLMHLRLEATERVLDVGFGGGYLIGRMLNHVDTGTVNGVDASAIMVRRCRRKFSRWIEAGRLDVQHGAVDALPFRDGLFTKVCSVNSMFYWDELRQGIREVWRVLSDPGLLVLGYTCQSDLDRRRFPSGTVRSYSDTEVVAVLRDHGFQDVQVEHGADRHRRYAIVTGRKQHAA